MPLTLHVTCHWIPYEENLVVLLWCQGSESYQKGAAFLSLAFLSKRLSIQLTWETLPISEALWKTHSKNLSLSSLQRITVQRQMQKYPAEGRSCDSCAVLSSLLGWTWGLVYISRSCRPETPKCHFVLRWNLKPIITSFHNVCYYNSSVWLPCGLILLKKKKQTISFLCLWREKYQTEELNVKLKGGVNHKPSCNIVLWRCFKLLLLKASYQENLTLKFTVYLKTVELDLMTLMSNSPKARFCYPDSVHTPERMTNLDTSSVH